MQYWTITIATDHPEALRDHLDMLWEEDGEDEVLDRLVIGVTDHGTFDSKPTIAFTDPHDEFELDNGR